MTDPKTPKPFGRRYRWPWLLLAGLIIGIVLTILWMAGAVRRVKRIRESTTGQAAMALFAKGDLFDRTAVGRFPKKTIWPADAKEVGVEEPR